MPKRCGTCLDSAADDVTSFKTGQYRMRAEFALADIDMDVVNLSAQVAQTGQLLGQQIMTFQALDLRLKIEANLLQNGGDRISMFQLPQALGGVLELVREIVEDTIDAEEDAGGDVACAREALIRGDAQFGLGDYKEAYRFYRIAYQGAVRNTGDDDDDENHADECFDDDE